MIDAVEMGETEQYRIDPPADLVFWVIANSFLVTMHGQFTVAAFSVGTFDTLRKHPIGIGHLLLRAFNRTWGIVVLSVIETLCSTVAYGYSAPLGMMISILWVALFYVAIPAMMVEGIGPMAALSRSKLLSKDKRGPIFGISILVFILRVLSWILVIPFVFLGTYGFLTACLLVFLTNTILPAIAMGVVYHDLRETKEGLTEKEVEDIFA